MVNHDPSCASGGQRRNLKEFYDGRGQIVDMMMSLMVKMKGDILSGKLYSASMVLAWRGAV